MNILFYRYGSICEPDIITTFQNLGLTVIEETTEIHDKKRRPSACMEAVDKLITAHSPAFVFTINFFPVIAEICHLRNILYLCWSVDCPVMELFAQPMQYDTNRIFLFDREQYQYFHPYNPDNIFYLPLAANAARFDSVINTITFSDKKKYASDICFIGSLYSEKNPLKKFKSVPSYIRGYLDGIIEASLQIYGYNFMEDALSDALIADFKQAVPDLPTFITYPRLITGADKYAVAHKYMAAQATEAERIRTLNTLAEHFTVDLYTASDTSPLQNVHTHGTIESLHAMPKAFHISKINLNMTTKSIQSGLPLRIFDIMGCGGFLMTNYQPELPEYFTIGEDIETYSSLEELVDKCAFYLAHDDIRKQIALSGYQKVKSSHTLLHRITEMIRLATSNL